MEQFTVPQFIEVEDKIIGPVTTRQFIILLAGGLIIFILYKILLFTYFIIFGLLTFGITGTIAFLRINGQPFHFFLLNFFQTSKRAKTRVWNKEKTTAEMRAILNYVPAPPPPIKIRKTPLSQSRLNDIALVLDTGGVYEPE